MNKVILIGRLTKDVETRYGETAVARISVAVDRKTKDKQADFINCVAFGKTAEFLDKYFRKGMRIALSGRIQTGSYDGRDGQKRYTTDVVIEECEFCESKNNDANAKEEPQGRDIGDGWATIPDGLAEELPFA